MTSYHEHRENLNDMKWWFPPTHTSSVERQFTTTGTALKPTKMVTGALSALGHSATSVRHSRRSALCAEAADFPLVPLPEIAR